MRVIWPPRAIARAADIAEFIAADRPAAARRWVQNVFAIAGALRAHPRRGRKVPELHRDEIREMLVGEYRLIYRVDQRRIVILTIRHGRRLWDASEVDE